MNKCRNCDSLLANKRSTYCSNKCQIEFQYSEYIRKWKAGIVDGGKGNWGKVSDHVRKYLFIKYDSKCSKCGWSEVNQYTGLVPLEVEHVDGNAMNHSEDNLTLLCPNCHSLTSTYRGANKGNGRGISWTPSSKLKR